jgi:hypothetical protein
MASLLGHFSLWLQQQEASDTLTHVMYITVTQLVEAPHP